MSKSTGNFLLLGEAIDRYGADATRFALADAGDGLEDANFLDKTADDAILKLFTEHEWLTENINSTGLRTGELSWNDKVFDAEMNTIIESADRAYKNMLYREALKVGFYDLQNARNEYRKATIGQGLSLSGNEVFEGMHISLIKRYAEVSALLMAPLTPHWSESIWMDVLKHPKSIMYALWPSLSGPIDNSLLAAAGYVRGLGSKIRSAEDAANRKKKGKSQPTSDGPKAIRVFIASEFPEWQEKTLSVLKETYDTLSKSFKGNERELLAKEGLLKDKRVMPFVSMIKVIFTDIERSGVLRCCCF